jgi:DMSO reductase anchor subunit
VPGAGIFAALLALGAVVTVWCTGMIYGSLRTVPEWNHGLVPVIYMVLALATGAVLLGTRFDAVIGRGPPPGCTDGVVALAAGAVSESGSTGDRIDGAPRPTPCAGTRYPGRGAIRPLDPPHTQPNFVMREMGYAVARRHAARLRRWVMALLFAVPRRRQS